MLIFVFALMQPRANQLQMLAKKIKARRKGRREVTNSCLSCFETLTCILKISSVFCFYLGVSPTDAGKNKGKDETKGGTS